MNLENYQMPVNVTRFENEVTYEYQPKTTADFSNYIYILTAAVTKRVGLKTKSMKVGAGVVLLLLWLFFYNTDKLHFEFVRGVARPKIAQASMMSMLPTASSEAVAEKPKKAKGTANKPKNAQNTEGVVEMPLKEIEGFEGLQNVMDNTTGMTIKAFKEKKGKISYDLSPASVKDLTPKDVRDYIEKYSRASIAEMDKFGIPASITMAQAIIESRSGTSILAVKCNNHFGIKCFSKTCPTGHCDNHTDDHHKDFFRIYAEKDGSWRGHSEFLMHQERYKGLLKCGKNYKLWALKLREFGYATDPKYDTKLIGIIEKYELYKLDDL